MTAEPANDEIEAPVPRGGALAPLREPTFRAIWLASLLSNFGTMIQTVAAAWEMTRLTTAPDMIALVQTAMMLPFMLVAVPAGTIADLFDRRKVAIAGLLIAVVASTLLAIVAALGHVTPWVLLIFCALIGTGTAFYAPSWQASISEQVKAPDLPAAIALGSVSSSVARSFGPAIGGALVLAVGATAAFGVNAVSYLPLLLALFMWKRKVTTSNFTTERLDRAIVSGARFVRHSVPARTAVIRAFVAGLACASLSALTPLIAKDVLRGDASTYGLLLGAYGVGAVVGALTISRLRARFSAEHLNRACALVSGLMLVIVAASTNLFLSCAAMIVAGACWVVMLAMLNVGVQLSSPRWVTGRALAWYQAAITGGVAIGAWVWGHMAGVFGIEIALAASGVSMMLTPLLGLVMPLATANPLDATSVTLTHEPEVGLDITPRSGPVVVEVDYRVPPEHLDEFSALLTRVQSARLRNGAFDWSIARDIAHPTLWTERYHFPTWGDYLRQRSRASEADHRLYRAVVVFREGPATQIRRRLERPAGALVQPETPAIGIFPSQGP